MKVMFDSDASVVGIRAEDDAIVKTWRGTEDELCTVKIEVVRGEHVKFVYRPRMDYSIMNEAFAKGIPGIRGTVQNEKIGDLYECGSPYISTIFDLGDHDVLMDIGANIGTTITKFVRRYVNKVIAVEPHPQTYSILKKNAVLMSAWPSTTVTALNFAVVPRKCEGQVVLFTHPTLPHGNTSVQPMTKKLKFTEIQVAPITLSELLEKYSETTAIKVDVQGAEREILLSVTDWRNVTKIVVEYDFEYHPSCARFHEFVCEMKKSFPIVKHRNNIDAEGIYDKFPNGVLVHFGRML